MAHPLLVNACYRASRRERGRSFEVHVLPVIGPVVADSQHGLAVRDQLGRGFRRLPPDQRAVLVLHYYLELRDAEAAEILDIPIGTMKSRLNRATTALRAALEADDGGSARAEGQIV